MFVEIKVHDILGREVKTLLNQEAGPGVESIRWDGKSNHAEDAVSGVYFCIMKAVSKSGAIQRAMRKLVLLR